ncbi:peroxiredoxin [Streptomyces sp. NPDC096354]|uniref:peroxiredoxin n=1 Tax=Streptomyces sp. NPDC096354 TaxID=3366088 RepID=UPI0037F2F249
MSKPPELNSPAPAFTLPGLQLGQNGADRRDYQLEHAKGNPLVLVFYPGDDTAVCTKQLCSYSSAFDRFADLDAAVWAVSPQDLDSHESFARKHRLTFPLLSDTSRTVAKQYGIAVPGLGLRRSVFILDGHGVVRWKHIGLIGLSFPDSDTLLTALKAS